MKELPTKVLLPPMVSNILLKVPLMSFTFHCGCFVNDVLVFYRASNKRNRVGNHKKSTVKHQEAGWQKPRSDAANHQADPARFLQAVQWEAGQSVRQWLLPVEEWPPTLNSTTSLFTSVKKTTDISACELHLSSAHKNQLFLNYFLISKSRDESKVENSTTKCGGCVCVFVCVCVWIHERKLYGKNVIFYDHVYKIK